MGARLNGTSSPDEEEKAKRHDHLTLMAIDDLMVSLSEEIDSS